MRGTNCKSSCSESKKAFNTTSKESENKSFLVKTEKLGCYVKKRCMGWGILSLFKFPTFSATK